MRSHTSPFGVYHWDTFDNETFLLHEAETLDEAEKFIVDRYGDRVRPTGADRVYIVDAGGNIVNKYSVA